MKIEKTAVNAPSRKLNVTWITEKGTNGIYYSEEMAKELQEEIDWGLTSASLISYGWTKVITMLPRYPNPTQASDWAAKNCSGLFKYRYNDWFFENKEDAAWFMLRWS